MSWSIHGTDSVFWRIQWLVMDVLIFSSNKIQDINKKTHFQKYFQAVKLFFSGSQSIYLVAMWHEVYSALAWPVEAAVTPSGQRKDIENPGACRDRPSSKDKEHSYENTGTHRYIQALSVPTWEKQWANGGTEIWLVVLALCHCFGWEAALGLWRLSVLPYIHSSGKLYLCPLLAIVFTLAYTSWCGYPDKPNSPGSTHLVHRSIHKSTQGVLGG